jgi:hypothetical protein
MAKQTLDGTIAYVEFDGVEISVDFREFDPGLDEVSVDSTAGDDGLESSHKIRETVEPTMTVLIQDDATGQAIKAKLKHGQTGNLIWGPEGNSTGKEKWGIEARVVVNRALAHDAEQILDITFKNIGRDWLFDGRTEAF